MPDTPARHVPCVGGVVHDERGRLLVVLRAQEPAAGHWSIPGGRVEPGEDSVAAVRREVLEETGLTVEVIRHLGVVEIDGPPTPRGMPAIVYVAEDFLCAPSPSAPTTARAGDDAAAVAWVTREEFARLDLVAGLTSTLDQWGVLPR